MVWSEYIGEINGGLYKKGRIFAVTDGKGYPVPNGWVPLTKEEARWWVKINGADIDSRSRMTEKEKEWLRGIVK